MNKYSLPHRLIHWLTALLFITLFVLVNLGENFPKGSLERIFYINWHKTLGVTVFFLTIIRVIVKISFKTPEKFVISKWQKILSTAVHHSLYLVTLLMPLTGYMMSCAAGYGVKWFGVINLPNPFSEKNKEIAHLFHEAHEVGATIVLVLLGLHLAGVIFHVVKKESVLGRML